jgi:mono/diheme cytochrome c family protein
MGRIMLVACVVVLSTGLVLAAAPDLGTEQQRADGQQLYDKYCSQCHGDSGDGQGYATPLAAASKTRSQIHHVRISGAPPGRVAGSH